MWALNTIEKSTFTSFEKQLKVAIEKSKEKRIAVWGASVRGIVAGIILEKYGVGDFWYVDNDQNKQGKKLSNHIVKAFDDTDISSTFFVVSMEYQDAVKEMLLKSGLKEGEDFLCLVSSVYEELLDELEHCKDNESLILGASVLHTVPIDDCLQADLSEIVKMQASKKVGILGISCLGMRNMYYLAKIVVSQNRLLKKLMVVISWETLTSFHHMLPRTQKPELVKMLKTYAERLKDRELNRELQEGYNVACQRAKNYKLENIYSPNRMDSSLEHNAKLKEYLEIGIAEKLDEECEELAFLNKIMALASRNKIKVLLVIEPMNLILAREVYGAGFDKIYQEKCAYMESISSKYQVSCYDASELLCEEDFSTVNVVNEAVYITGRIKFAKYIIEKLENC